MEIHVVRSSPFRPVQDLVYSTAIAVAPYRSLTLLEVTPDNLVHFSPRNTCPCYMYDITVRHFRSGYSKSADAVHWNEHLRVC